MKFDSEATTKNSAKITFTPTGESAKDVRVSLAPLDVKQALTGLLATPQPTRSRKDK